jgi:hypothetical protein
MGSPEPANLFVSGSIADRVAHRRRCRFEVRRLAVVYRGVVDVAIDVFTGDEERQDQNPSLFCGVAMTRTMMVAGPPSTMHQSAHGRPNAVVRSARER